MKITELKEKKKRDFFFQKKKLSRRKESIKVEKTKKEIYEKIVNEKVKEKQ